MASNEPAIQNARSHWCIYKIQATPTPCALASNKYINNKRGTSNLGGLGTNHNDTSHKALPVAHRVVFGRKGGTICVYI